jgi:uncharacterized protein (UPF0333 family)
MIKMDQKGQISIEFVLIIAFMLVIVLLIASYAGETSESYIVLSAARAGATNAITDLSLNKTTMTPVRVEKINTNGSGKYINITIQISSSLSDYQNQSIINSTLASIAAQGYNWTDNSIVTSRHVYNVTLV